MAQRLDRLDTAMRAKTLEGEEIDLPQDVFNGWKARPWRGARAGGHRL